MQEVLGWEQLALDLAAEFGTDFVKDFCNSILNEAEAEREMAFSKQREIAAATHRLEQCFLDGFGECHLRLDPAVYFNWIQREGREIWNDKTFLKRFKKDNPEVVVKSKPQKVMVRRP